MGQSTARVIPLPKKPSFGAALKATKTKTKTKSKSTTMRTLQATEEIKAEIDRYVKAKKNWKQAESEMENSATMIREFILPLQDEDGRKNKYATSYAVEGNEESIKFISKNQFSMNSDDDEKIAEILGDAYDDLIVENHTTKLKDEVFENEDLSDRLMELLGDEFANFLETTTKLGVVEGFNKLVYNTVDDDKLAELRVYCRPYKASLR